jgi:hypothetical protein
MSFPSAARPYADALSRSAVDRDVVKVRQHFVAKESLRAYTIIRRVHNEVCDLRHWKQCESRHIMTPTCLSTLPSRYPSLILTGVIRKCVTTQRPAANFVSTCRQTCSRKCVVRQAMREAPCKWTVSVRACLAEIKRRASCQARAPFLLSRFSHRTASARFSSVIG